MRRPTAALLTLFVSGCAAVPASESPSPDSTPAVSVEVLGDGPAFDPGPATGYAFMLPGAGLVTADGAHAWVVGFGEQRGDQEVMHLTSSADGSSWQLGERGLEEGIGLELRPPGPIPSSLLPPLGGEPWVMYFSGSPGTGADGADIWRATAAGPEGPWVADTEPVLARSDVPGENGGDPVQLDFPAVVRTNAGYLMLFGWSPSGATTLVRSATSADGITWSVADAPALDLGVCGGFDSRSVVMPRLAADGSGGWLALYGGFAEDEDESMALGVASSTDGATWRCASAEPILEFGDIPGSERLHSYAALASDGAPHRLLLESLVGERSELWLAELRIE